MFQARWEKRTEGGADVREASWVKAREKYSWTVERFEVERKLRAD